MLNEAEGKKFELQFKISRSWRESVLERDRVQGITLIEREPERESQRGERQREGCFKISLPETQHRLGFFRPAAFLYN